MKRVAVLGGGPAGAFAAEQLASRGIPVQLFDEKLAWEKPCGGGLTHKAYRQYPFLLNNSTPKRQITEMAMGAPKAGAVNFKLDDPLLIYSRFELNAMLLSRAEQAGVQIEKARVLEISRSGAAWRLRTSAGTAEADFCIVATGARNPLRDVGTQLGPEDVMSALGYYVPGTQERIDIQFLPRFEGYIWVFPRCGHLSVGICGKGEPAAAMRRRLELFMDERGIPRKDGSFYSHVLPSLATGSWKKNRVAGDGWMAVGDAAGLVDPVTGEGIYYAIRSADLAARSLVSDEPLPARTDRYRRLLREDFAADLEFGSRLARRIYLGKFLFDSVSARMVQFTRRSARFGAIVGDLVAGRQPYTGLKRRLWANVVGSLGEILLSTAQGSSLAPGR